MAYLKVVIHGPFIGTEETDYIELPEDWDELTATEQEEFENDCWDEAVANYIDGHTEIVESTED